MAEPSKELQPRVPESTGAMDDLEPIQVKARHGGGIAILAAGIALIVANFFEIYPIEVSAEHASWRDSGYAIVLVLAGMVLVFVGRSMAAIGAALLVAILMLVFAVVLDYPGTLRMMDFLIGLVALAGCVQGVAGGAKD